MAGVQGVDVDCAGGAQEVQEVLATLQGDIDPQKVLASTLGNLPALSRAAALQWSNRVLAS